MNTIKKLIIFLIFASNSFYVDCNASSNGHGDADDNKKLIVHAIQ